MAIMKQLHELGGVPAEHAAEPDQKLAVVACMDARMDVYEILCLKTGDAHVIRNAGGVITDDVIRSLAVSQHKLGTRHIMLLHHTKCGMAGFDEEKFRDDLTATAGFSPEWSADGFDDVDLDVLQSVARIRANPFVPFKGWIGGYVYDVDTEEVRPAAPQRPQAC
ncbi:beta-class carbonic anhydrase [Lentzea sp. JNUCC 0626]|uniref:beta-class carbonic anhydrase n=1 Tax=Lentzea sp. JNUCC 0626 TaxID=3367513 RepID=UPI003749278A